ncbi:MAG TPA: hypothetical protein VFM58_20830 [Solirubrobacteraceae bacterium]|nr:hypothetical protein [Solirubrobacteraceae bacterium]
MKRIRNGTSRSTGRQLMEAHAQWREAAQLVALRWDVFLQAGGDARGPGRDGLQWPQRDGLKWPQLALVDLLV